MRFCDFIITLFTESSCSNQGQFILEVFSALCGETNPKTENHEATNNSDTPKCSKFLPSGLSNPDDSTYRKRLFQGNNKKYVGLSNTIKSDILNAQNENTKSAFLSYCKLTFADTVIPSICQKFEIRELQKDLLFLAIYRQFIEFAKSPSDDVIHVMSYAELTCHNNLRERNKYFSGRIEKLDSIDELFNKGNKDAISICQTVSGLGGIGKTQLAIEYAYRYCGKYPAAIWFVIAESSTTIFPYFKEFAEHFDLPLQQDFKPEDLQNAVKNWLANNSNWLLIFDNIETADVIKPYLPSKINGRIILTSRNIHIDFGIPLKLEVFNSEESVLFLKRRFSVDNDEELKMANYKFDDFNEYAPKLAERLGFLPLALEQAAAYIKNMQYKISDYLKLLGESSVTAFKDEDAKALYYESIITDTWKVSFSALSISAKQLFNLCAYMAPDRIPVSFFVEMRAKLPSPLREDLNEELTKNRVVKDLKDYSLASGEDVYFFNIHRLVQEVVRKSHDEGEEI